MQRDVNRRASGQLGELLVPISRRVTNPQVSVRYGYTSIGSGKQYLQDAEFLHDSNPRFLVIRAKIREGREENNNIFDVFSYDYTPDELRWVGSLSFIVNESAQSVFYGRIQFPAQKEKGYGSFMTGYFKQHLLQEGFADYPMKARVEQVSEPIQRANIAASEMLFRRAFKVTDEKLVHNNQFKELEARIS